MKSLDTGIFEYGPVLLCFRRIRQGIPRRISSIKITVANRGPETVVAPRTADILVI